VIEHFCEIQGMKNWAQIVATTTLNDPYESVQSNAPQNTALTAAAGPPVSPPATTAAEKRQRLLVEDLKSRPDAVTGRIDCTSNCA
jgi:hypothetical protein